MLKRRIVLAVTSAAVILALVIAGQLWRREATTVAASSTRTAAAPGLDPSEGRRLLQDCVAAEQERGGSSAVVSPSGWSVAEARQLTGIRAIKNLGTRADPRPSLVQAQPLFLVAGSTPDGDSTAVCVMGGGPESGYGLLWASLGPTGVPAGHVPAPVSVSGILGAEHDSVVYGWYADGVSDITAKVAGEPQTVTARNGFWSATVRNPEQPSPRGGPELRKPPAVEVSGKSREGSLAPSNRFAAEIIREKPCWTAAPTTGSKCGVALRIG